MVGWLFGQGIIEAAGEITGIGGEDGCGRVRVGLAPGALRRVGDYQPLQTAACAGGQIDARLLENLQPLSRDYPLDLPTLKALMKRIFDRAPLFHQHGGIHCAMLADMTRPQILVSFEDIGRSNTLDKAIGWGLLHGVTFEQTALFTTGRITMEMALKAQRARIPCLASLTTLTDVALDIARRTGLTLAGHLLKPRPILINF